MSPVGLIYVNQNKLSCLLLIINIGCWYHINAPLLLTLELNSARKSKCFFRSVARMASMTRNRKRLNSTWSKLPRKLNSGWERNRLQAEAAWWFSKTERSLYSTACVMGRRMKKRRGKTWCAWVKRFHAWLQKHKHLIKYGLVLLLDATVWKLDQKPKLLFKMAAMV